MAFYSKRTITDSLKKIQNINKKFRIYLRQHLLDHSSNSSSSISFDSLIAITPLLRSILKPPPSLSIHSRTTTSISIFVTIHRITVAVDISFLT